MVVERQSAKDIFADERKGMRMQNIGEFKEFIK